MDCKKISKSEGITLLEILLVIAISSLLLGFVASPLLSFYRQIVFQGATENVLAMLDEARKSTLSSYYSSQYGVYFDTDKVVLFRGATYSASDPNNDVYTFNNNVQISTTTLSGGVDEVVFSRITGETSASGTVTMSTLIGSTTKNISIHSSGLVEVD